MGNVIGEGTSITGAGRSDEVWGAGDGASDVGASLVGEPESVAWGVAGARADPEKVDTEPVAAAPVRGAVPAPAVGGGFSLFAAFAFQVLCCFFCKDSRGVVFFAVVFGYVPTKGVTRWFGIA